MNRTRLEAKDVATFNKLQQKHQDLKKEGIATKAILCLNGEAPNPLPLGGRGTLYFIVDGALNTVLSFLDKKDNFANLYAQSLAESLVICTGDFDSCNNLTQATQLLPANQEVFVFRLSDQSQTDFYKTLELVQDLEIEEVHIYGFGGKSTDHLLGNFTTVYQFKDKFKTFKFYDNSSEIFFLKGNNCLNVIPTQVQHTISLFPFYQARDIKTSGLHWNLDGDTLDQRVNSSIRNYADATKVTVSFESGDLLCFKGFTAYENP